MVRRNYITNTQITLIKKTWKLFRDVDPVIIGDTFYSKLFNEHPSIRKMFPADMNAQYHKLIEMLSKIVSRLETINDMDDELAQMAQRHVGYGVRPAHYKLVGRALLWTLRNGLGDDWSPPVEDAWKTCYTLIAEKMIGATEQ